jgi:polysaccharide export outer membrane protein
MKLSNYYLLAGILYLVIFSSCNNYKKVPYFQDLDTLNTTQKIKNFSPLTVQPGDILALNVSSSNPEASSIFNYNLNTVNGTNMVNPNNPVIGYLVTPKGEIVLPTLGAVKVSDLTLSGVEALLRTQLTPYLKECVVNVRLINFKISVTGDVQRPGVYSVQNESCTLNEALTMAGDLNITALRNILIIREKDGNREFIHIDLTSKNLFQSPYYYLKSNDIVYVPPGKNKFASVDNNYRTISLVLAFLSIVAIVVTR